MSSKPTILIVPGSFSLPPAYDVIKSLLIKQGYPVEVVPLLSAGRRDPLPPATMENDAANIHSAAFKLADAGKDVVLLMHSYGGIPGSEATRFLLKNDREAEGKQGGIIRLIYFTSFALEAGTSSSDGRDAAEENPLINVDGDYLTLKIEECAELAFSETTPEKAVELAKAMTQHAAISFAGKATYAPWKNSPVSWIFTEKDKILTPEVQQKSIDRIEADSGRKIDLHSIPTDHCANETDPERLLEAILKAVSA